jgi:hypothetical protein
MLSSNFYRFLRINDDIIDYGCLWGPRILDRPSGVKHHLHDCGRDSSYGHFKFCVITKNRRKEIPCRCDSDCEICHGTAPGCVPERKERKLRQYKRSLEQIESRMTKSNQKSLLKISIARNLACMFYFKSIMLSNRVTGCKFSLYFNPRLLVSNLLVSVQPYYYPRFEIIFQNQIYSDRFLTWKKEFKSVVISRNQMVNMLCIGGISRVLTTILIPIKVQKIPIKFRCFRECILRRLFSHGSIHRLHRAGGLNRTDTNAFKNDKLECFSCSI